MLRELANKNGLLLAPVATFGMNTATSNMVVDATGESAGIIGHIRLSSGPGTSKTLDTNGKIHIWLGSVTWANGASTARVGVQDIGVTGLEDGTWDVYAALTGGAGLTANTMNNLTITNGSKTIAHGDQVALLLEMTNRAGADSIVVIRSATSGGHVKPYATVDSGTGPGKGQQGAPYICIEFGDGTLGWMDTNPGGSLAASGAFGTGSNPDEVGLVFRIPFRAQALGFWTMLANVASTDDFKLTLYSDPLGTPVAQRTFTEDADLCDNGQIYSRPFTSPFTLEPNTYYCVAFRPTTANTLSIWLWAFGSGGGNLRAQFPMGLDMSYYLREAESGAFGSQSSTLLPVIGLWISALSDDVNAHAPRTRPVRIRR